MACALRFGLNMNKKQCSVARRSQAKGGARWCSEGPFVAVGGSPFGRLASKCAFMMPESPKTLTCIAHPWSIGQALPGALRWPYHHGHGSEATRPEARAVLGHLDTTACNVTA